jgi:hypothetical protein
MDFNPCWHSSHAKNSSSSPVGGKRTYKKQTGMEAFNATVNDFHDGRTDFPRSQKDVLHAKKDYLLPKKGFPNRQKGRSNYQQR